MAVLKGHVLILVPHLCILKGPFKERHLQTQTVTACNVMYVTLQLESLGPSRPISGCYLGRVVLLPKGKKKERKKEARYERNLPPPSYVLLQMCSAD